MGACVGKMYGRRGRGGLVDESEMDIEWMWSGARMDEKAGRDERKSMMYVVGESLKTSPIKGVTEVVLPK